MQKNNGFTLIELIVVIVILSILAAVALPKFSNVTKDARIASVSGLAGGLRSATAIAEGQYMSTGSSAAVTVTMKDGSTVDVLVGSGYPKALATGITAAMRSVDGYSATYAGADATFRPVNGGSATCQAIYTETTGSVATTTTGC